MGPKQTPLPKRWLKLFLVELYARSHMMVDKINSQKSDKNFQGTPGV